MSMKLLEWWQMLDWSQLLKWWQMSEWWALLGGLFLGLLIASALAVGARAMFAWAVDRGALGVLAMLALWIGATPIASVGAICLGWAILVEEMGGLEGYGENRHPPGNLTLYL